MALYLDSLGVAIEKPFETSPLEPDENGYLEYCVCQHVLFGICPEDFTYRIGDVTFGRSDCHPSTKIAEEHFVLDFYPIRLPFEEPKSEVIQRRNVWIAELGHGTAKCIGAGFER